MKKIVIGVVLLLFLTACPAPEDAYRTVAVSDVYDQSGNPQIIKIPTSGYTDLDYTLNLGANPKNGFFIFTNLSNSTHAKPAYWSSNVESLESQQLVRESSIPTFTYGSPKITAENNRIASALASAPISRNYSGTQSYPSGNPDNDTDDAANAYLSPTERNFKGIDDETIAATCRFTSPAPVLVGANQKTLSIFVADDCWEGNAAKQNQVNQTMVNQMAAKFLSSSGNSIWQWESNIIGQEFGNCDYSDVIAPKNNITILLYDIEDDNDAEDLANPDGYTTGVFHPRDMIISTTTIAGGLDNSNERVMFYIDAVLYATPGEGTIPESGTWSLDDYWPETQISTLVHEFQHMILFYNKYLVSEIDIVDTWLNEMMSLMAEDILADKLGIGGPRAIVGASNPGSPGIFEGRLQLFNTTYDLTSLTNWEGTVYSYSHAYAFGAYLLRNFGGAQLLQELMQQTRGDYRDVTGAIQAINSDWTYTFEDLVCDFMLAGMLSDLNNRSVPFIFNKADYTTFRKTINSVAYDIGSINLYNYRNYYSHSTNTFDGPYSFYKLEHMADIPAYASTTYNATISAPTAGVKNWKFRIDKDVQVTVLIR